MSGLIVKDFYLLFQRKQTLFMFLAVCLFMGFSTDGSFVVGYMTFLSTLLAMSTISYDEFDNGMMFLMTLPIERKTYARSKYVLGGIFCCGAWVLSIVMLLALNLIKGTAGNLLEDVQMALAFLPMIVLILDIMIPLQLKFGPEKSRIVMVVIFGGLAAVGTALVKMLKGTETAASMAAALDSVPGVCYVVGTVIFCVVLTAVSVMIAQRVMEKKAF